MTDELRTDPDRDPQKEGGRVQPGDGHALAEQARADAIDEVGDGDSGDSGDGGNSGNSGESGNGGEVSSVQNMDGARAGTPISDSQSVAGQPDGESGSTDEGPTGPNSRGGSDSN